MYTPLVSVNIICYNQAPFLKQRIDSVLQQTYFDFELLIWDDASTDDSKKIIEQYRGHNRVSEIIYNSFNSGNGYTQWQDAIEKCQSKYLWIAEGDDFAEPSFLKQAVKILEENPTAALVETDAYYIENNLPASLVSEHKNITFSKALWTKDFVMKGEDAILDILAHGNCIANVSNVLFRADVLKQLHFNFSGYKYSADWFLYINLFKKFDYAYLHQPLSYFRLHSDNATKKGRASGKALQENFSIINKMIPYLKQHEKYNNNYIKSVNRYITIFGVPFSSKISLLVYYLTTNFSLAIKGLYYNFKSRFGKNNHA